MASNLSCIGFSFADAEEFQRAMIELAQEVFERLSCESGDYSIWRSRTGAEIWFHLPLLGTEDSVHDIAGLTPFFEGSSEVVLNVIGRVARPGDNSFEGAFTAEVCAPADDAMAYPLTFDAVDYAAHHEREVPFRCRARIVGFARQLKAYRDEASYAAAATKSSDRLALAPMAFIPVGQFVESGIDDDFSVPESTALLTGRIIEQHVLVNEKSGRTFIWLQVQSLAATYDIVAEPDTVEGEIIEGGTVEVGCLLLGRLLGD